MIYEDRSKRVSDPKKEDFIYPGRGIDAKAYDAAKMSAEIENACYTGVYKDEETGEVLFSVYDEFIPDANYWCNGQGTSVKRYMAHFELKPGQTAEEAFHEREKADKEKRLQKEADAKHLSAVQALPDEIKQSLAQKIDGIKKETDLKKSALDDQMKKDVRMAEEQALMAYRVQQAKERNLKRQNNPAWRVVCAGAKALVKSGQREEAKTLVLYHLRGQNVK